MINAGTLSKFSARCAADRITLVFLWSVPASLSLAETIHLPALSQ